MGAEPATSSPVIRVDVMVRAALVAGPAFRYPWALEEAATEAARWFEMQGYSPWSYEFDVPESGLDAVAFEGCRPSPDGRYAVARFATKPEFSHTLNEGAVSGVELSA